MNLFKPFLIILILLLLSIAESPMKTVVYSNSNPFRGYSSSISVNTMGKVEITDQTRKRDREKTKNSTMKLTVQQLATFKVLIDSLVYDSLKAPSCTSSVPPKDAPSVYFSISNSGGSTPSLLYKNGCTKEDVHPSVFKLLDFIFSIKTKK